MPSLALLRWRSRREPELDELEAAHQAVGGSSRGRRYATLRVNHAYAVLLSSAFQAYCRDLHSEAVDYLVDALALPPASPMALLFRRQMTQGRKLDTGNPNPGNLGADFGRVFVDPKDFWKQVIGTPPDAVMETRKKKLERLNLWRNAIAHQDWSEVGPSLWLSDVRAWRAVCRTLATRFDLVVGDELRASTGKAPWQHVDQERSSHCAAATTSGNRAHGRARLRSGCRRLCGRGSRSARRGGAATGSR